MQIFAVIQGDFIFHPQEEVPTHFEEEYRAQYAIS